MQAIRKVLSVKLPPAIAKSLSVVGQATKRACQWSLIIKALLFAYCSGRCLSGRDVLSGD